MFEGLFQPMHLLIIAGVALLIFGPKKLPELGKGIGEGIRGFKAAINPSEKPDQPVGRAGDAVNTKPVLEGGGGSFLHSERTIAAARFISARDAIAPTFSHGQGGGFS